MQELIETMVRALVDTPDAVKVTPAVSKAGVEGYEVRVHPADVGKVLGKQGRIANGMRILVKAAMRTKGAVYVDIIA